MKNNVGFYAGSFDPFTNGHLHVVKQSSNLFDRLVIGMGINPKKTRRYNSEKMKEAIENVLKKNNLTNVSVIIYSSLSVDAATECGATCFVRGIRNGIDYDYEENLASINKEISNIDTIYIRAGELGHVSSSMVMELLNYGRDVSKYLPEEILNLVLENKI